MRSVKSRGLFEQMKGRGSRIIDDHEFHAVTPTQESKTCFVIVDAVGVCEQTKTDDRPLERKASLPLKQILDDVAVGKWRKDEDLLPTLAGRLGRLSRRIKAVEEAMIKANCGNTIRELAAGILTALDVDRQLELAQQETGQSYLSVDDPAVKAIELRLIQHAVAPFDDPDLRNALMRIQQRDEQIIDVVSQDTLISADWDRQAEDKARQTVATFRQFIAEHRDEITALQVFYQRPQRARLSYNDIKRLHEAIKAPPLGLTTDKLWQAYETLEKTRVCSSKNPQHMLTDIVSLIRYTSERDNDSSAVLEPYSETIARRFAAWLTEQERLRGKPFTDEQHEWLILIRDTIASSMTIETEDFEGSPFFQKGGLGKANQLFGADLPKLLQDLNERLVA